MSSDHARHNEALCRFLSTDGRWPDWVITTAFYSALHFVEGKIFPLREDGVDYPSMSEYCSKGPGHGDAKHNVRMGLVCREINASYDAYLWLYRSSHNARYVKYDVDQRVAEKAVSLLDEVIRHC